MQARVNEWLLKGYWREIATVLPWIGIDPRRQAGCMIRPPETEFVLKTTQNSRPDPSPLGPTGQPLAPSEALCRPPLALSELLCPLQPLQYPNKHEAMPSKKHPEFSGASLSFARCSAILH
jgi:hypothetical protein